MDNPVRCRKILSTQILSGPMCLSGDCLWDSEDWKCKKNWVGQILATTFSAKYRQVVIRLHKQFPAPAPQEEKQTLGLMSLVGKMRREDLTQTWGLWGAREEGRMKREKGVYVLVKYIMTHWGLYSKWWYRLKISLSMDNLLERYRRGAHPPRSLCSSSFSTTALEAM